MAGKNMWTRGLAPQVPSQIINDKRKPKPQVVTAKKPEPRPETREEQTHVEPETIAQSVTATVPVIDESVAPPAKPPEAPADVAVAVPEVPAEITRESVLSTYPTAVREQIERLIDRDGFGIDITGATPLLKQVDYNVSVPLEGDIAAKVAAAEAVYVENAMSELTDSEARRQQADEAAAAAKPAALAPARSEVKTEPEMPPATPVKKFAPPIVPPPKRPVSPPRPRVAPKAAPFAAAPRNGTSAFRPGAAMPLDITDNLLARMAAALESEAQRQIDPATSEEIAKLHRDLMALNEPAHKKIDWLFNEMALENPEFAEHFRDGEHFLKNAVRADIGNGKTTEDYLNALRTGRRVPLSETMEDALLQTFAAIVRSRVESLVEEPEHEHAVADEHVAAAAAVIPAVAGLAETHEESVEASAPARHPKAIEADAPELAAPEHAVSAAPQVDIIVDAQAQAAAMRASLEAVASYGASRLPDSPFMDTIREQAEHLGEHELPALALSKLLKHLEITPTEIAQAYAADIGKEPARSLGRKLTAITRHRNGTVIGDDEMTAVAHAVEVTLIRRINYMLGKPQLRAKDGTVLPSITFDVPLDAVTMQSAAALDYKALTLTTEPLHTRLRPHSMHSGQIRESQPIQDQDELPPGVIKKFVTGEEGDISITMRKSGRRNASLPAHLEQPHDYSKGAWTVRMDDVIPAGADYTLEIQQGSDSARYTRQFTSEADALKFARDAFLLVSREVATDGFTGAQAGITGTREAFDATYPAPQR